VQLFAQKLASAMESSARGPIDSFASTASPLGTTHSAPSPDGQSSWRYEQRPFSPSSRSHYRRRRHHHHHHHSRRFAAVAADEEEGAVAIDGGGWSEHERAVATATIARQERQLLRLSSQNLQLTIDLEASRRANQRLREDFDAEIDSSRRLHNRLSEVMSVAPDATRTMATSPHEAEPPLWRELESGGPGRHSSAGHRRSGVEMARHRAGELAQRGGSSSTSRPRTGSPKLHKASAYPAAGRPSADRPVRDSRLAAAHPPPL
jgi:hypothetical protein